MINIFELPNVSLGEFDSWGGKSVSVEPTLSEVITKLSQIKPGWEFRCIDGWDMRSHLQVRLFAVYQDGTLLGRISHTQMRGSRKYGVRIDCKRIKDAKIREDTRAKNEGISTGDAAKAVSIVRRMFGAPTTAEQIEEAAGRAHSVLGAQHTARIRKLHEAEDALRPHAMKMAMEVRQQFADYLHNHNLAKEANSLAGWDVMQAELELTGKVRTMHNTGKTALILKVGGLYLVKTLDVVTTYDDTTLPEKFRGPLGMLKLVNDQEMVTGIGCRVDQSTFVVINEEKANAS